MTLADGTRKGVIHHLDGDYYNNVLSNLAAAHRTCHGKHHHASRSFTPEHRAAISEALKVKGIHPPRSGRTGIGKGVPKTEAHKAAIAEGQRLRWAKQKGLA